MGEPGRNMSLDDALALNVVEKGDHQTIFETPGPILWAPFGARGAFGGQLGGLALAACGRTVDSSYSPHSLFLSFLSAGNTDDVCRVTVHHLRDGRGYCMRTCRVEQNSVLLLFGFISFHNLFLEESGAGKRLSRYGESEYETVEESGGFASYGSHRVWREGSQVHHSIAPPSWLRSPESCLSERARLLRTRRLPSFPDQYAPLLDALLSLPDREVDIRYPVPLDWMRPIHTSPHLQSYMRFQTPPPPSPDLHPSLRKACALVYATDFVLLQTAALPFGWPSRHPRMMVTLNHTMWFHDLSEAYDPMEWIVMESTSPALRNSCALVEGKVFSKDGTLLATASQEGVVRLSPAVVLSLKPKL